MLLLQIRWVIDRYEVGDNAGSRTGWDAKLCELRWIKALTDNRGRLLMLLSIVMSFMPLLRLTKGVSLEDRPICRAVGITGTQHLENMGMRLRGKEIAVMTPKNEEGDGFSINRKIHT